MTPGEINALYEEGCRLYRQADPTGRSQSRAEKIFRSLLRHDPLHHRSWNMLGVCLESRREHAKARKMFHKAIGINPRGLYYLNLGITFAAEENAAEALEALSRSVSLEPGDPSAHFNLGCIHYRGGAHQEAVACWERARKLDPGYPDVHLHLAIAHLEGGRFHEAEAILEDGIRRFPDPVELRACLSRLLESTGRCGGSASLREGSSSPGGANAQPPTPETGTLPGKTKRQVSGTGRQRRRSPEPA